MTLPGKDWVYRSSNRQHPILSGDPLPQHIGIIPDGVRRWARQHHMPLELAYRNALENLAAIVRALFIEGVRTISLYGLSKNNLNRLQEDLEAVSVASIWFFDAALPEALRSIDCIVKVAGDRNLLPKNYEEAVERLELRQPEGLQRLYILAAYSPVDELSAAWTNGFSTMEELISALWVPERVDLVIRTGGSALLSDFLPLQCGYASIVCTEASINDLTWERVRQFLADGDWTNARRGI